MRKTNLIESGLLATLLLFSLDALAVATCTSKASGNWNSTGTWNCVGTPTVTTPGASNFVVIANGHTVNLNNSNRSAASLTINAGGTLDDDNKTLTISGDVINNGTFGTSGGSLSMTGANSTISGSGTYSNTDIEIDALGISLPSGSTITLTNGAQVRVGNNATAGFTLGGTLTGTALASGDRVLRVYQNSSATINGTINAPNAYIRVEKSSSITNNGSVNVQYLDSDGNNLSAIWTQGVNSSLTVSKTTTNVWRGTLNASASGNTVTYNSPATPLTPSSSTYYNLAGTGVTCPHGFTILGSNPCVAVPGTVTVTMNPGSCSNATGIGTVAWTPSPTTNVNASDNAYATASVKGTTNYLKCTGYNFAIPATATILGVVVNVERKSSSTSRTTDGAMRLVKAGVIGTTDRATATTYSTTDVVEAHGSSVDLWGTTWTPADINSATFGAAFAAKSTKTRTISADHMPISVTYSAAADVPHHIQIEHSGAGKTCAPEQLTVKACADAACTTNFNGAAVSGNVTWSGSPGGTLPFSIASGGSGQTTVSLSVTTAQTVTLGTSTLSPTPTGSPASSCTNAGGIGAACDLDFTASTVCMDAVEVGAAASTPIYTKLAGTAFSLDVRTAAGTNYTGTVQVELVNAASGSCSGFTQLNTQNVTFSNQKVKTVAFTYANAAGAAKVRMTAGSAVTCSSDGFAIRPTALTVSSSAANADATGTNATATPVVAAGAGFTLSATAIAGYNGTPTVDAATPLVAHTGAVATGALGGSFAAANAATGVASGTFTYGEVGYFKFGAQGVIDKTFANLDAQKATPECTPDYSNTLVGGKYGCYFGNTAATDHFGRFVPDHFDTVVLDECDTFTYSGQPFPLEIQAKDAAGATLQNYDGSFAKAVELSDASGATSGGGFTPVLFAASAFVQGVATETPAYAFANIKTAPTLLGVRAVEAAGGDGVSSATGAEGGANIRGGRLALTNAYGSELINLPVPMQAEYWNGSRFIKNADDHVATCTSFLPLAVTLQPGGAALTVTLPYADPDVPGNVGLNGGDAGLALGAPGVAGYADVTLDMSASPWLQYDWVGAGKTNPTARATFGVYKGNDVFIYRGRRGR